MSWLRAILALHYVDHFRLTIANIPSETLISGLISPRLGVFQDFFVDLDLPVTITQGDRISIPVSIYSYADNTGDERLQRQPESWFVSHTMHCKRPSTSLRTQLIHRPLASRRSISGASVSHSLDVWATIGTPSPKSDSTRQRIASCRAPLFMAREVSLIRLTAAISMPWGNRDTMMRSPST